MLSYHNDESLKSKIVAEMKKHQEQDQFVKKTYGKMIDGKFKGCAVGCAVESMNKVLGKSYENSNHHVFKEALGIPEWIAYLQDRLFESLPIGENSQFAVDLLEAIPVGVDLNPVKHKFLVFVMKDVIKTVEGLTDISDVLKTKVLDAVKGSLNIHESAILTGQWDENAAEVAWKAADAARDDADSACDAARAASRADWSSSTAAWASVSAAKDDVYVSSATVYAAYSGHDDEFPEKIKLYAEKLIELLKETKGGV